MLPLVKSSSKPKMIHRNYLDEDDIVMIEGDRSPHYLLFK